MYNEGIHFLYLYAQPAGVLPEKVLRTYDLTACQEGAAGRGGFEAWAGRLDEGESDGTAESESEYEKLPLPISFGPGAIFIFFLRKQPYVDRAQGHALDW